jgi:hypothetical protein
MELLWKDRKRNMNEIENFTTHQYNPQKKLTNLLKSQTYIVTN